MSFGTAASDNSWSTLLVCVRLGTRGTRNESWGCRQVSRFAGRTFLCNGLKRTCVAKLSRVTKWHKTVFYPSETWTSHFEPLNISLNRLRGIHFHWCVEKLCFKFTYLSTVIKLTCFIFKYINVFSHEFPKLNIHIIYKVWSFSHRKKFSPIVFVTFYYKNTKMDKENITQHTVKRKDRKTKSNNNKKNM